MSVIVTDLPTPPDVPDHPVTRTPKEWTKLQQKLAYQRGWDDGSHQGFNRGLFVGIVVGALVAWALVYIL